MQPIIGSTPTRQPAPNTSAKAATFSVPNLASKPASHAPVVRHAVGGVQHSQTAYRPGAQAWRQSQAAAASNTHSAPVTRERDISSITPRSRSQAHYIGTSAQVTQSPQPTLARTAASSTAHAQQPSSQDNHTEQPAASAHQPQQSDSQRPAGAPRQPTANQKAAWQQYHSAWQNYYQQYYERYYLGQVKKAEERLAEPFTPSEGDLDLVRGWLSSSLDAGVKASSVGKYLSSVKSFYRYLIKLGLLRRSPIQQLRPPKADKPLPVYVPTEELNRLIDEPQEPGEDWQAVRDRLILAMLYECGLRRSELAGLADSDVDTRQRQLKVLGKGRKERIVPFGEQLAEDIERWRSERTQIFGHSPHFLLSSRGKPLSDSAIYRVVHAALRDVPKLTRRGAHALRHSFATDMLNAGGDLMLLRELMGHNSVSTTVRYTHTSFEQLRKLYAAHPRAASPPKDAAPEAEPPKED